MAELQPADDPPATAAAAESESETEEVPGVGEASTGTETAKKNKKKKSKKAKVASALGMSKSDEPAKPAAKMSDSSLETLLEMNPALKGEFANMPPEKAQQLLKNMDLGQLLTGLSLNNKNQKDMASYKFWQTQPVPRFDEQGKDKPTQPDGPIKEVIPDQVPKTPAPLPEGYEWVELDLTNKEELKEVYTLLTYHYVEDDNAMFRFNYSKEFLDWALKAPEWKKIWHVGVRAQGKSRLLVASVFGIPTKIRVRKNVVDVVEINYLCIHKRLRGKRLTPVLIKEITRRCNLEGIYQAIYTAGIILPTPVSTCRYFHRPLQWMKLYEVGFSPLPPNSTPSRMIKRNQLPPQTTTKGWREMQEKDVDAVLDLLCRYLNRFELAPAFTRDEVVHWLLNTLENEEERVVWTFVVEDPSGKITDFASFYNLESSVIGEASKKHEKIRAAYLYYYASELAFTEGEKGLKERLQNLIGDLLIEAKKANFDVFNALTLLDNPLFLEQLKFGAGDGQLHYYLYNWRTPPVSGGVDKSNMPDERMRGGMGMVML